MPRGGPGIRALCRHLAERIPVGFISANSRGGQAVVGLEGATLLPRRRVGVPSTDSDVSLHTGRTDRI